MVGYYPDAFNIPQILRQYKELEMVDDMEEERLVDVMERKKRGKGAPKKAKKKGAYAGFGLCRTVLKMDADVVLFFAGVFYVSRGQQKVDQETMMGVSTAHYRIPEEMKGTAIWWYLSVSSNLHSVFFCKTGGDIIYFNPHFPLMRGLFFPSRPPNLHPPCEISGLWQRDFSTVTPLFIVHFPYNFHVGLFNFAVPNISC